MPIRDLAGLTLECTNLERAAMFYTTVLGLRVQRHDEASGVLELGFRNGQFVRFWQPITRRPNDPRLARIGARGGTHVHYAMQVAPGALEACKALLKAHAVAFQTVNLGDEERPDWGAYFFDPFGHGLELREVRLETDDAFAPLLPVIPGDEGNALPIGGLREVALAFEDFQAMLERLPRVYGFCLAKLQEERDFAQFTLGEKPEPDGQGTPRRWLYAWDPQVGIADMLGGEHATVTFHADLEGLESRLERQDLEFLRDDAGLAVRDASGHVFEFLVPPKGETP
jgi:catechol 2,3-dioxygenase-like lactoylglutathione lyase family enzyme